MTTEHERREAGGGWYRPLLQLTLARTRETIREPAVVFSVFIFLIPLILALGVAFRTNAPQKIRVAVENPTPPQVIEALKGRENIQAEALSAEEAGRALRAGKVELIVRADNWERVPSAPSSENSRPSHGITYTFDPTRPEGQAARLAVDDILQRALGRVDVANVHERRVTEPGARYIDFLVPGLIGMNLMGSGLYGFGFVIVQARSRKLLKRLAATPMRKSHYLLSFLFSRLAFLLFEVLVIIIFTRFMFDVVMRGSVLAFAAIAIIGAMSSAGIGLLVAARPRTVEGVTVLMNAITLPMWLLSGSFFSWTRFPEALQPAIRLLPLTALNDSLRAVMNDGAPLASTWPQICIMLAWGVVCFILALKLFRWQ